MALPVAAVLVGCGMTACSPASSGHASEASAEVLAPGVVPRPGQVGYLGSRAALTVLDPSVDAPAGSRWVGRVLQVERSLVLDHVWVKASIDFTGSGTLSVTHSVVEATGAFPAVIWGRRAKAHLDLRDSTITYPAGAPYSPDWGTGAVNGDASMTVLRCDISGASDGIQQGSGNSAFTQNYIHGPRLLGAFPDNSHNDGIQLYAGPHVVIRFNDIAMGGFDGTHQDAAVFLAAGPGYAAPEVVGNELEGGGYPLRIGAGTTAAVVVDNHFGPVGSAFGSVLVDAGVTIRQWSGNVRSDGTPLPVPPGH